jgi:hypothetical protein
MAFANPILLDVLYRGGSSGSLEDGPIKPKLNI